MGCDASSAAICGGMVYFNPRTRMGCDSIYTTWCQELFYFNPRTRMGCDLAYTTLNSLVCVFQSTHPYGVRRANVSWFCVAHLISIHAPVWGATWRNKRCTWPVRFQSTHPYGVRHTSIEFADNWKQISIHAPVWGATVRGFTWLAPHIISIHAPVWGATFFIDIF